MDGLAGAAMDASADAAASVSSPLTIDVLESRIRAGRRARRVRFAAVACAAVLATGGAALAVPHLVAQAPSAPLEPAGPEALRTEGALTVYADGTMSLVTAAGAIVDLPAPQPDSTPYATAAVEELCATDVTSLATGWSYAVPQARELLGHARPQHVAEDRSRHPAAQGQQIAPTRFGDLTPLAFELDADAAAAPHLGVRASAFVTWDHMVLAAQSQLDGAPAVDVVAPGTAQETATVQMRALEPSHSDWCVQRKPHTQDDAASASALPLTRYLVIDVFLIDRSGSSTLLATHTSWTRTELPQ